MLEPVYTNYFTKDVKLAQKRKKKLDKLKEIIRHLVEQRSLPEKNCDHKLQGDYADCRECHIEPDWLLIYRITGKQITFIRTGTHSDLFR